MTTSSEDVLLQVGQVRYKKGDGTLYVMSERLAWMLDHRDTVSVSHRYTDIKLQKISPEGKAKIQLQVVLHDNTTSTFQFVNKQGAAVATRERDQVKDLLVQLLPKFKRKVNKELEEKNRLLSENPALLQLYRDLVITQVISPEEFWSQHASNYTQKQQNQKQDVGVSSAFLADIKPQTDGCNGLRYNLTADIIECIFKTYPAVRKKHMEYVPGKLSESEFWTKFFQSHYFHRDRIHSGTKDIFTECAKLDDLEMKKEMSSSFDDPLVDISYFEDKTLGEGYGISSDKPTSSQNIVHQSMIKRFNQHSIMVMKASSSSLSQTMDSNSSKVTEVITNNNNNNISNKVNANSDGGGNLNKSMMMVNGSEMEPTSSSNRNGPVSDEHYCTVKKMKILEKISYDDLGNTVDDMNGKPAFHTTSQLNLTNVERYLQGPVSSSTAGEQMYSQDTIGRSCDRLKKLVSTWSSNSNQYNKNNVLVSPPIAVSALGELTPGGALMKGFHEESLAQLVPPAMEKDLRHLYTSGCELLRHFWACFPPTTVELQEKVCRMHDALHRFHSARLQPFEDRVLREYSPLSQQLSSHLNQLLTTAYAKFELWQSRRKPALSWKQVSSPRRMLDTLLALVTLIASTV